VTEPLPLVSVGVIAHDQGRFVEEALESVVASDYPRLQLLVLDDGSRDGTDAAVRRWIAAHPGVDAIHVRHETARGLGATLNEAVRLARGELLTGLAADDVLLPEGIRARVDYLRAHPEKLAVFADAEVMDGDGRPLHGSAIEGHYERFGCKRGELLREELLPFSLAFHWAIPGPVFLCRRESFDIVGPYDEALVTEDFDMYLRLAAIGKLGFLDRSVARYRVHAGSMTSTRHARMLADAARAARLRADDFRGAIALRLRAQYHLWHAREEATGAERAAYWIRARAESALAHAGYGLERWRLSR